MQAVPLAVTFLFSDIEGSVRLWEQLPQQMRAALALHDALAEAAVAEHGGRIVKTTGDGIHAVFDRPANAVQAALCLQLALADPAATAGLALHVRCGLHAEAAVSGLAASIDERRAGDFYGPAVNRAARIMGVAHGGQTLLSQALVDCLGTALPPEATLLDIGRVRLRDLSEPERVYQLQHPRLLAKFPPLRSLEATPNNLAQQLNSFVGRERETAEVRHLLAESRLLTLLGMGGIGKSRLSVQLGAELLDEFADGVWLIELAALTDPRGVPQALASALGVKEEAGRDVTDSLLKYVRDKQALFIFDNCEHVVDACAALAKQLLQAGAGIKLLASSRSPLQLAGEATYPVPRLRVPDPQAPIQLASLMHHEAVRLFVDRAVAARAGFRLTETNAAAVVDICHRLDGIPLALELAAARVRVLSVEAISARLGDRFRLLVTSDRTVLPRQRTLRALIDWSHDLLPEAERLLFRRLAVFAGGWTLEAAEAVGSCSVLPADDVLEAQAQLVEKSLVVMAVSDAGEARYRLLDTVRHYALEQLEQAGEGPATRTRQLEFHLAFAETARPELAGPQQGKWLARLDLERENFLAAHQWSAQAPRGDHLGLRLMYALRPYWFSRGELSIALRLAEEILQREGLRPRDASRCMALLNAGVLCYTMGRHQQAHQHLLECLTIARETNNDAWVAHVLQPLGAVTLEHGDFAAADRYLDEAVRLAQANGEPRELLTALTSLAMLHRLQGRLAEAEPLCEQVIALARQQRDALCIGLGLLNLAMVVIALDDATRATDMLREVTLLAEQTGSLPICQSALEVCAGLAAQLECWEDAASFFGAAEAQGEAAGLRRDSADNAFLEPRINAVRAASGERQFAEWEASGRRRPRTDNLVWLRNWLAAVPPSRTVTKARSDES